MILIFGGTTEGKKAAALLDKIGQSYLYSTKTKVKTNIAGEVLQGALSESEMTELCLHRKIKLIIDAAHPFAENLRETIFRVKTDLGIPVIRFERIFPDIEESETLRLFSDYAEMIDALAERGKDVTILALTGVNTIPRFEEIWRNGNCYFRILDTELSMQQALHTGISPNYILPAPPQVDESGLRKMIAQTNAQIILTKESGESGYFLIKEKVAKELNIPLWVVRKPLTYQSEYTVNSEKQLLQIVYILQKDILRKDETLRSGYTTGSCITAAAGAAFRALMENKFSKMSEIVLPDGEKVDFLVFDTFLANGKASCIVVKNAGDDPDITHSAEMGCRINLIPAEDIVIEKGKGIGIVTLPGLQVAVGEPAINPVPRKMIEGIIDTIRNEFDYEGGAIVTPFIPEGEALARKTFNPRIGIVGGLSVLGTTGRVFPYSAEAFEESIRQHVKVARQDNSSVIVCTSGKRSEMLLNPFFPELTELSYVHYGNLVGKTLSVCNETGFSKIVVGIMLGKAIKLAEGHLNTHSKEVVFNPDFVAQLANETGYSTEITDQIRTFKLANSICEIIPFGANEPFYQKVGELCYLHCNAVLDKDREFELFLIQEEKVIHFPY